jgi:hypothetical protein
MGQIDYHGDSIVKTNASGYELTLTGVKAGEITITVHNANDYNDSASFKVIVYDKFSVSPATKTLAYGGTVTLTPNTTDAVTYTIKSGSNLIDISGNTVTAKSGTEGTAVIEAKNAVTGETATVTITIVETMEDISKTGTVNNGEILYVSDDKLDTFVDQIVFEISSFESYKQLYVKISSTSNEWFGDFYIMNYGSYSVTQPQSGNFVVELNGSIVTLSDFTGAINKIVLDDGGSVSLNYTITYDSTNAASTSNLSLYGASMATMLYGADAEEEESVEIKGQLVDTITLHGSTAWEEGKEWQATISNLEVYDPNGDPYYYWVIEEHTHKNYAISYLYKDEDDETDYCINAEKAGSDGIDITVANTKEEDEGVLMPSTGGEGTMKFYCTGGAMILLSVLAGSNRMRRRIKERRTK